MQKVAIIGGGASGLACAIEIMKTVKNRDDVKVTVIEKLPRVGKKILVTGNGRCNLTNMNSASSGFRGDTDFAYAVLNKYTPESNIDFSMKWDFIHVWKMKDEYIHSQIRHLLYWTHFDLSVTD